MHPFDFAQDKHDTQKRLAIMAEEQCLPYYEFICQLSQKICKERNFVPRIVQREKASLSDDVLEKFRGHVCHDSNSF